MPCEIAFANLPTPLCHLLTQGAFFGNLVETPRYHFLLPFGGELFPSHSRSRCG